MVLAGGTQGLCLEDDLEVAQNGGRGHSAQRQQRVQGCLLYTSDAADEVY